MGYTIPVTGTESGTWGDEVNDFLTAYLDLNMAAVAPFGLSASNITLTADEARRQMLRLTGTLLADITISPSTRRARNSPIASRSRVALSSELAAKTTTPRRRATSSIARCSAEEKGLPMFSSRMPIVAVRWSSRRRLLAERLWR